MTVHSRRMANLTAQRTNYEITDDPPL